MSSHLGFGEESWSNMYDDRTKDKKGDRDGSFEKKVIPNATRTLKNSSNWLFDTSNHGLPVPFKSF